jgi:hypothetical protein
MLIVRTLLVHLVSEGVCGLNPGRLPELICNTVNCARGQFGVEIYLKLSGSSQLLNIYDGLMMKRRKGNLKTPRNVVKVMRNINLWNS